MGLEDQADREDLEDLEDLEDPEDLCSFQEEVPARCLVKCRAEDLTTVLALVLSMCDLAGDLVRRLEWDSVDRCLPS